MLRQSVIYLILSILAVLFARYLHVIVAYVHWLFVYINTQLTPLFNNGTTWGAFARKISVLMLVPLVIAGTPALVYRGVRGREMPHFLIITWTLWTIVVLSNIIMY